MAKNEKEEEREKKVEEPLKINSYDALKHLGALKTYFEKSSCDENGLDSLATIRNRIFK